MGQTHHDSHAHAHNHARANFNRAFAVGIALNIGSAAIGRLGAPQAPMQAQGLTIMAVAGVGNERESLAYSTGCTLRHGLGC